MVSSCLYVTCLLKAYMGSKSYCQWQLQLHPLETVFFSLRQTQKWLLYLGSTKTYHNKKEVLVNGEYSMFALFWHSVPRSFWRAAAPRDTGENGARHRGRVARVDYLQLYLLKWCVGRRSGRIDLPKRELEGVVAMGSFFSLGIMDDGLLFRLAPITSQRKV